MNYITLLKVEFNGFLVLGLLAIVLAVILIVASRFLYVEEDKTTAEILEALPAYNCGACGYWP